MGVDFPDGHKLSVIRGWDGSEFRNIKVSSTGELYILLSALYNSTIKSLKCDAQGNAFLNVKAQDLAEVINRPKYGGALRAYGATNCPAGSWTSLFSISGKGMIYGGWVMDSNINADVTDQIRFLIDGNNIYETSIFYLQDYSLINPLVHSVVILKYDTTNKKYVIGFAYGITFETSVQVLFKTMFGTYSVDYSLCYALV